MDLGRGAFSRGCPGVRDLDHLVSDDHVYAARVSS
jgi:hypothetical protein